MLFNISFQNITYRIFLTHNLQIQTYTTKH